MNHSKSGIGNNVNIKIVSFEKAYENIHIPEMQEYLAKMVLVRSELRPRVSKVRIPFDVTDFIDWHYVFCLETPNGLKPIAATKQGSLKRYDEYKMVHPLLGAMRAWNAQPHAQALEDLLNWHRKRNLDVGYGAGFTIMKEFRHNDL